MCQHHFYLQFQMPIKKSHQPLSLSTRWRLYLIALAYPCAALGHGGSPLLARKICFDFLGVDKELTKITSKAILQMSVVFAFISATLHQLWFFYNDKSDAFIQSLLVMALGNLLGTALVLTTLKLLTPKIDKVPL